MTDRKKVMSWLEGLTDDDWRRYHSDSEVQNIAKAALELLKEQKAVKPVKEYSRSGVTWWYICGSCWTVLNPNYKYCYECGRPLKWK